MYLTHHCTHTRRLTFLCINPVVANPHCCTTEALLRPDLLPFTQCTTCNLPNAAYPHCHCTATLRPLRSVRSTQSFSPFQPPHDTLPTSHSVRVPFTRMLEIPRKQLPAPGESEQNALPWTTELLRPVSHPLLPSLPKDRVVPVVRMLLCDVSDQEKSWPSPGQCSSKSLLRVIKLNDRVLISARHLAPLDPSDPEWYPI